MTDLSELLERVKAATGPDRALDLDIWCVEMDSETFSMKEIAAHWTHEQAEGMVPHFTASIDAALALVDRMLPEANCYGAEREPSGWTAYVSRNDVPTGHWFHEAQATTAPLAILLAALTAIQSIGDE